MNFNVNRKNMTDEELELHKKLLRKKHNHNHYLRKKARLQHDEESEETPMNDSTKLDELLSIVMELKKHIESEKTKNEESEESDEYEESDESDEEESEESEEEYEEESEEESKSKSKSKSKIMPPIYDYPIQFV